MRIPTGLGRPAFACFMALLLTTLLSLGALAQIQNGTLSGDITDPSGAAIAHAKVTIKNQATDFVIPAVSNQQGHFVANQVPVGVYRVTVEAPGFKSESHTNVQVNAGSIAHSDYKLQVGAVSEVVEVTGAPPTVNTEDSKLGQIVSGSQVANLPLNGRNVYDLIQMAPGAVNVQGVITGEYGHGTVVNGLRTNFNGFLINGITNKDLSGGPNNTPIQDTVQEFQQLTLNNSAQYGSSAGSITNLVTKSGTNSWHGSGWEFIRNDKLDANNFFLNQVGVPKQKLRFNQWGGTFGGPIVKDKLFFFVSYQQDHFNSFAPPTTITVESQAFRDLVTGTPALANSVSKLLYSNFAPAVPGVSNCTTLTAADVMGHATGVGWVDARLTALAARIPAGGIDYTCDSVALYGSQVQAIGNLFQGKEASGRIDYQPSDKNRFFLQYAWQRTNDSFGPCTPQCTRGFTNPTRTILPNGQLVWDHTFSAKVVNEARVGYTMNNLNIGTSLPGVPAVYFDDGTAGFGSYSGYPQYFKDHQYAYSDMVSISKGSHNLKIGVDVKRNIENSEFNIARPSYEFADSVMFAVDAPYFQTAGTDPGFISGTNAAQLADNYRHWRNLEIGAYFQDDWKVTKHLTLNLGIRYDLFTRHNELNNLVTQFIFGPGNSLLDNISTGAGQLKAANTPCITVAPFNNRGVLAGECGPGGFAKASALGSGDHNNFGPRLGFAWDVFGNGKTALRGGVGVSYESTLYNPLSNSRWNPPFYSFGAADDVNLDGGNANVIYGPMTCPGSLTAVAAGQCVPSGATPTYLGAPANIGIGVGTQAVGNISGWYPGNPDFANLTGIVPKNIRDPYVYNYYLGLQHEIAPKLSIELDYVGTVAHKLFRADNINRLPGSRLPVGSCVQDNLGRTLCGQTGHVINQNYGTLRIWENTVNSNYNGLQLAVKKQTSHGLLFNLSYTWSHSLDGGSSWHSGSTTANGVAGGDGYTSDWTHPSTDYGNSIFDIRHRLVLNYVWDLPLGRHTGFMNAVLGGWQLNGIWSAQTGAHWSPFNRASANLVNAAGDPCTAADVNSGNCTNIGGDYMLSSIGSTDRNSRPNSTIPGFSGATHDMWANGWGTAFINSTFSAPCLGCSGNLRRNQFVGPGQWFADMSLFKNFKVTERVGLQFRAEGFNVFNHTNFILADTAAAGSTGPHNQINQGALFGQAGTTLNPRNLQFGVKVSF